MLEPLRYPLQSPGWISMLIFALGGWFLLLMTGVFPPGFEIAVFLLMSFNWYVLAGLFHCYGSYLFHASANGHSAPPRPPPEIFDIRSAIVVIVLIVVWSSATLIRSAVLGHNPMMWSGAALAAAIAPASIALMVLGDSAMVALDPRRIARFVQGLGAAYLGLVATLCFGYGAILITIWYCDRFVFIGLLAATYVYLLTQHFAGRIVFSRRGELALDTERSPEQDVAADVAAEEAELRSLLFELHRLCGVDRYREAFARLDAYLSRDRYRNDARVHERLRQFQGRPLALEHACQYIERLIEAHKALQAWEVCKRCLDEDELFRPLSDASVIALVALSGHSDARYVDLLLGDFARAYPQSTLGANAMFRLAQVKIEHLNDRAGGATLLRAIRDEQPQFARLEKFGDYISRLDELT